MRGRIPGVPAIFARRWELRAKRTSGSLRDVGTPPKRSNDRASFDEASLAILAILDDGGWHKRTKELGQLAPWIPDHMFGKVKKHYKIEHRQMGGGAGSYTEWRRPN